MRIGNLPLIQGFESSGMGNFTQACILGYVQNTNKCKKRISIRTAWERNGLFMAFVGNICTARTMVFRAKTTGNIHRAFLLHRGSLQCRTILWHSSRHIRFF